MDNHKRYERLLNRYRQGDVDRRTFLGLVGKLAVAGGVTGPAMGVFTPYAAAADTVRFDGWGGVSQAAQDRHIWKPFAAKTGVTVNQGSYGSLEEYLAKVQAGRLGEYHYCSMGESLTFLRFLEHGYAVELDEAKLPGLRNLIPKGVDEYRKLMNGKLGVVPYQFSSIMIAFNREKVDRAYVESKGANILLDPKFKGKIAGEDQWLRRMWYAALQTNQDPNNITDLDAIWEKIRESKRSVLKYWTSGAEQMNLFATGETWISDAWSVRVYNLRKQGYPIETYFPKGIHVSVNSLMPLKGAPLEPFYQAIDILLQPDVLMAISLDVGLPPLLDPRKFDMPKEIQAMPGFDPTGQLEGMVSIDARYWNEKADNWQRTYKRVLARG